MRLRSLLYVPAHSERFLSKAHERGADALILDLEDAVPEVQKDAARDGLVRWVGPAASDGAMVLVRINAGPRQREDALAACRAGAAGLVIPKAGDPDALEALAGTLRAEEARLGRAAMAFMALIETPAAVLDARSIARVQRVAAVGFGGEDLAAALGAEPSPEVLRQPRLMVHYAAKAEGKLSLGLLQSTADYADLARLGAAASEAAAHGFDGATCVHPSAVPMLNAAFSPSAAQLSWAQAVVAQAAAACGPFTVDGKMVDAPVIARARAVLAKADGWS
jgi:citrate lyase subunit beta/citryl-CoA lyase